MKNPFFLWLGISLAGILSLQFQSCMLLNNSDPARYISAENLEKGAQFPGGMLQVQPLVLEGDLLGGFSHTAQSSYLGDFLLLPISHEIDFFSQIPIREFADNLYSQPIIHKEFPEPGLLQVGSQEELEVEILSLEQAAMYRIIFPLNTNANLLLDPGFFTRNDDSTSIYLMQENMNTLLGFILSRKVGSSERIFFVIRFSSPFSGIRIRMEDRWEMDHMKSYSGNDLLAFVYFPPNLDTLKLKVGLSSASIDGAIMSMRSVNTWNFDTIHQRVANSWQEALQDSALLLNSKEKPNAFYSSRYEWLTEFKLLSDSYEEFNFSNGAVMRAPGYRKFGVGEDVDAYLKNRSFLIQNFPELSHDLWLSALDDVIGNERFIMIKDSIGHLPDAADLPSLRENPTYNWTKEELSLLQLLQ